MQSTNYRLTEFISLFVGIPISFVFEVPVWIKNDNRCTGLLLCDFCFIAHREESI